MTTLQSSDYYVIVLIRVVKAGFLKAVREAVA